MKKSAYDLASIEMKRSRPNLEKAARMLEIADSDGDPRATYAIGTWYLFGRYYEKDEQKAVKLIARAARNEISDAQFDLAVAYETGIGIKKDDVLAALNYLRAALNGDQEAFHEVGRCYYHGIGVTKDRKMAKVWFDHALSAQPALPTKPKNRRAKTAFR